MFSLLLLFVGLKIPILANSSSTPNLNELLTLAYKNNPELLESQHLWRSEDSLVTSKATLEDPIIGLSELDRGLKTQYGTITQKIKFPTKYYYLKQAQKNKSKQFYIQINQKSGK